MKDKNLIWFDSASSITFKFNLWIMEEFCCSENFIYLNDDCFIGKPMQKSDLFYVGKYNRAIPYVLFNEPIGFGQYAKINPYHHLRKTVHKHNISSHSCIGFE